LIGYIYKFIGLHPMLIYNALSGLEDSYQVLRVAMWKALKVRYISALGVAL
jgi:hypothetical protein